MTEPLSKRLRDAPKNLDDRAITWKMFQDWAAEAAALEARNAALEKVAEAAIAYRAAVERVADDEGRGWPVGDGGDDTALADALAALDGVPKPEARP